MGKSAQVDAATPSPQETDAAKVLEEALLQMDGIIADAGSGGNGTLTSVGGRAARTRALDLAQQLAAALQHSVPPPPRPDYTTTSAILRWISTSANKNDVDERVVRLESDKESLQLQVQVLSEQISAQVEKMADLERSLMEKKQQLEEAQDRLQKEILIRSSLETQKLELLSALSEVRLRAAEKGVIERVSPPAPPRTPPANYNRQIERNSLAYSSLPRVAYSSAIAAQHQVTPRGTTTPRGGRSVPNLAEKDESRCSPSPSLRLEGGELTRGPLRATAGPRLLSRTLTYKWQNIDVREWDTDMACSWLESAGLGSYASAARAWHQANPEAKGLLAEANGATLDKELGIKHPLHRKKILLAMLDFKGGDGDPLLSVAGHLDTAWVCRWTEDVGLADFRASALNAALDGRTLHRLTHKDLSLHLRTNTLLHALSLRRGIQVLRENMFNPETMIRRASPEEMARSSPSESRAPIEARAPSEPREAADAPSHPNVGRWSSHRVMQWLNEIDLAEYAPNLRGAGVHGGLMLHEPRFTAELLASLLNIPASKTLLRRHLTQRFNDLLGREVIQQKRNAEQTLGYQPLTLTSKYKTPKKSQFSLRKKKSQDDLDLTDLVCPLNNEDVSDDESKVNSSLRNRVGCLSPA